MELKIKGKINSLSGFTTTSGNPGDIVFIKTVGKYLENEDLEDEETLLAKNHIDNLVANSILPIFIRDFSTKKYPENFFIRSIRVDMFNDKSKNTISFNKDAKIFATLKLKNQIKINESIMESDIEKITSLYVKDKDPDSAIILLMWFDGNWKGFYDFTYNRNIANKKYVTACEYTAAATSNFDASRLVAFYNDVWSAYELLIESTIYLSRPDNKPLSHRGILKSFMSFCQIRKLSYYEDYEIIYKIRNNVRYGRNTEYNMKNIAHAHLDSLKEFSNYVKKYLINHNIIVDDANSKNVSSIQKTIHDKQDTKKIISDDTTSKLLKKSAHYRGMLHYFINFIIGSIYYRFNISGDKSTIIAITWDNSNESDVQKINDFFMKEYEDNINHLLDMDFEQISKLNSEIIFISQQIDAEKTPNSEFPQDEHDLIIDLKEELSTINYKDYWVLEEYSKYGDNIISCLKNKKINSKYDPSTLKRKMRFFYTDMQKIVMIILKLSQMYDEYDKKFPDIAFKGKYH